MSKRSRMLFARTLAVTAALVLSLSACGGGASSAASGGGSGGATPTVRAMKAGLALTQAPYLYAVANGLFDAAGIQLTQLPDASTSTAPIQALLAGQVDVALVGGGNAVLAGVAAGQDLTTVALFAPQNAFQLVLSKPAMDKLAHSGVTSSSPVADRVAALKGLTLATTGPGNAIDAVVRATLQEHGVAPDMDVTLRAIPDPQAMLAAFRQGQVDGFSYGLPITTQPVVEGTGAIWVDYITGEVPDLTALPAGLVVTTKQYAAAHRDELVRFVTALGRGFDSISTDSEKVKAAVAAKYFPQLAPDLMNTAFEDALPVFAPGPVPTEAAYAAALKVYNGDQTTKTKVTAAFADVMDPSIAKDALAVK